MTKLPHIICILLSSMCVMESFGFNETITTTAGSLIRLAQNSSSSSSTPRATTSSYGNYSTSMSDFMSTLSPSTQESRTTEASASLLRVLDASYASLSVRHQYHNAHPWGPHFEDSDVNVTVTEGANVLLDCKVGLIEDKLVSWVRRKSDKLDLLTLGTANHSSDPRILSDFKYPNNWRLSLRNTSSNDSGVYLCQISAHPPKVLEVQLTVQAPRVFIVNSRGERINEVHYKEGSTLQLICSVNNMLSKSMSWFRNKDLLNQDVVRGGVSIKTDLTFDTAKSILKVASVTRKDGGNYICSAPPQTAFVTVHILIGENPAELYRNKGTSVLIVSTSSKLLCNFLFAILNMIRVLQIR